MGRRGPAASSLPCHRRLGNLVCLGPNDGLLRQRCDASCDHRVARCRQPDSEWCWSADPHRRGEPIRQGVATTFRSNSSVLFDIFNEPYPDSNQDTIAAWTCWRDGGTCPGVAYTAAGSQELVNAIRGTGATNVIMVGGVQYTNTLSRWL